MKKQKNYIELYYGMIEKGEVAVSEKIRRLYKHLFKKLQEKEGRYVFDRGRADYAIEFIERFCKHSKGKWAGKPVILEMWQKALLAALFGFVDRKTGRRQYKELILIVARKNGKSTLAAAIGVYLLMADGEQGPEIVSAATKRDQAKIIWEEAGRMIQKSPALSKRCKCLVGKIVCGFNDGSFVPLASDTNNQDGLNIHGALIDELHAVKDKNTYDVLVGGVDLSSTTDLTCASILFKVQESEEIFVEQMYWIPEDLLAKRVHEDRVPYDVWLRRGFVRTSPGNSIDYRLIVDWFLEMQNKHDVYLFKVDYDAWSAKYFVNNMTDAFGEPVMVPVIQGKKTLSGPMKSLAAELEAKTINYNNNPVLKWCMANVCIDIDRNANIQPAKGISAKNRIDGFASLLDAYVVYCNDKEDYENMI